MFTVMVVDKRKHMLQIYKTMIKWERYEFEIISFANTEEKAMAYYREYQHDIVICDVVLKEGSGLSLVQSIRSYNPLSKIIVITYDDAYDSMRIFWKAGVCDYLLKDRIRSAQLIENLQIIKTQLMKRKISNEETWESELQEYLGLMKDHQKVDLNDFYNLLKQDELHILCDYYVMLNFRLDNVKYMFLENKIEDRTKLKKKIKHAVEKTLTGLCAYKLLFSKKHAGLIVVKYEANKNMDMLAKLLLKSLSSRLSYSFSITISKKCRGYEDFYEEYRKSVHASCNRFYIGDSSVMQLAEQEEFKELEYGRMSFCEKITKQIDSGNFNELIDIEQEMIKYMKSHLIAPADVIYYYRSILHEIEHAQFKKGIVFEETLLERIHREFLMVETSAFLQECFHNILHEITVYIMQNHKQVYSKLVVNIIEYIEEHLPNKITLEDIATYLHRNPVHISRVFKKQTGESLIQFVNKQKVKKAKELLIETNMKIKDVAAAVGIENQLYFNKVFKKSCGESPRAYRKAGAIQP